MKIAVGTKNPVKLKAVESAFKVVWPSEEWEIIPIEVSSGVSDQPMSDEDSIKGARTRAIKSIEETNADFGVGVEGGVQKIGDDYFDTGWIVVVDKDKKEGIGSAIKVIVPKKVMELVLKGEELGTANDIAFGLNNSKQKMGHFGIMTKGIITREKGYTDGVVSALSIFMNVDNSY